jgi:hypothetical protein
MIGTLYFIQEGTGGAIKIGWTSGDPAVRLRTFQVGNSFQLLLIGAVKAMPDEETGWHVRFAKSCKRSEWFYPTADLLEAIAEACTKPEPEIGPIRTNDDALTGPEVYEWVRAKGIELPELAKALRYGLAHVALAMSGSFSISPRMAYRLEKFSNGELKAEAMLLPLRERQLRKVQEDEARASAFAASTDQYIEELKQQRKEPIAS